MFTEKYYLKILLFLIAIPLFIIGWYLYEMNLLSIKTIVVGTVIFAVYGIPIDIYLTSKGVWKFGDNGLFGKGRLFGLPFEEYLFYVLVIPFVFILFTLVNLFV